ncbi:peptidylprolyl isomerase [Peptostreptococcus faecalis]|uniref:peptidylprolyl isomerase n=1 Tax=Peptostreptococcus faecalis TaxID=2045015 RepID=UPI000C7DAF59|nr:peptidylprolyl isomerase [Peptostreptococcus faecalis]
MKKLLAVLVAAVIGFSTVACTNNSVAVVDSKSITKETFENQLKFNKWVMELQYGDSIWTEMKKQDANYQDTLKTQVLESLVQTQVYMNYAKKNNIEPDAKQLKQFKEQNKKMFENADTKKSYEKTGLSKEFMDGYAEQVATLTGFTNYIKKKSAPTEKELKEYYEKNSEKVDASHILISTVDENGKALSEDKKKEAKKKADELYKKAKDGADFATLAKENSQDTGSAENGGSLGEFGKGSMVEAFENTAFSLKEGEISQPVESEYGYHIIKLNKKTKSDYKKVKDTLKTELTEQKAQEMISKITESASIEKFDDVVKEIPFGSTGSTEKKTEDKKDTKETTEKKTEDKKDSNESKDTKDTKESTEKKTEDKK